jgi:hypothetical protein
MHITMQFKKYLKMHIKMYLIMHILYLPHDAH